MPDQPSHLPERERQPSDHDGHDRYLIAAFATDDLTGAELTDATALVARCQDCAALLADLRSIASATAELPVPARTRDFRLSEEDARRLRPGGWRQVVGFLAGPRLAFAKPLATALTTIGLAGLLLFSVSGFLSFGSAGAAPLSATGNGAPSAASEAGAPAARPSAAASPAASATGGLPQTGAQYPAASGAPGAPSAAPAASVAPVQGDRNAASSSTSQKSDQGQPSPTDTATGGSNFYSSAAGGPPLIVVLSTLAIGVGLALFAIRWGARRLET